MNPYPLIAGLVLLVVGFGAGWKVESWRWDAALKEQAEAKTQAVREVRNEDHALQDIADEAGKRGTDANAAQLAKAKRTIAALELKLKSMPACYVPADVISVLDDAQRPAGPAADPGPASAPRPAEPPVDPARAAADASEQLAVCAANYAEVCVPNARERDELRSLYNAIKDRFNKGAR